MNEQHRIIIAFAALGKFLREFSMESPENDMSRKLQDVIRKAGHNNGWFTSENVLYALKHWGELLTEEALTDWLKSYLNSRDFNRNRPKTIAIVMAGNIPLVGFHDFLSVLLTGNKALAKLSSNDNVLLYFVKDYLVKIEPLLEGRIRFVDGKMKDFDAVIATGSDNTARYFEYYFGKVPNLIRKNRNSVAVLTGQESDEQLNALGEDIFRFYGLGCRSVSKIFVPDNYDFDRFFESIYAYHPIIEQTKYANNYDYNKAVYLMSEFRILDNGFLILKEDESYASPIASLFYERYTSLDILKKRLEKDGDLLQCVVSNGILEQEIPFGRTQIPKLIDYADGVDTVDFLLNLP